MQVPLENKACLKVKCLGCSRSSPMEELRPDQPPYRLPNPAGGSWAITYYYCRCGVILVYEPGDGGDLVLLEMAEITD